MKKRLLFLLFTMSLVFNVRGQTPQVSGKVTDLGGKPLDGVTVTLEGTTTIVVSNSDGTYSIAAKPGQTLIFSIVGADAVRRTIEGTDQPINVQLDLNYNLDEVVVTGYQTERKKDLTGAVAIVDVEEMRKQAVANPMKALQGQVPGMYITGNGAPSSPATVRIRGVGTLNNNDPLYIIDGVPTKAGMHEINQADIESMQVLKDASAASIYGSRAANGVIVITTKHGKQGSTQLNANVYSSLSSYVNRVKMLDTEGYGRALWQASVNSGSDPNASGLPYRYDWQVDPNTNLPVLNNIYVPEYLDEAHTMRSANTDWFDEISQIGVVQNYDVQLSNGTENGNYLLSLGYFDNKGVVRTTGFNRISARFNSDYKLFDGRLTIGENMSLTKTREVATTPLNESTQALPIIPCTR
ncbi:TonB-dependent receptor plug domain-containing protein [Olivibacter sitiensis]|uniref:TonB-dependent receptor plug domain-containing protein n=1 Tax=Olivibacter sitiensis TaxID=376470 RepID=UPI00042740D2|nr:TonB-dependent receptor plug domain-containing protein [Olivibacter sitiensis]